MKEHGKLFMDKYYVTLHPAAALRNPANIEIMRSDFRASDFLGSYYNIFKLNYSKFIPSVIDACYQFHIRGNWLGSQRIA